MDKDHYATLGVPKNARDADIKEAYRRLALLYNSDENCESNAEDKRREIAEAYEVLSNKSKKEAYDRWTLYTGPKLFAKPQAKTNLVTIQKAILKALEGKANEETLTRMQNSITAHSKTCVHFIILFRNRYQFRGLYEYDEKQHTITKLDGIGPRVIKEQDIIKYYKYDIPKREFTEVQTRHMSLTIIGLAIQDHLWSKSTVAQKSVRAMTEVDEGMMK